MRREFCVSCDTVTSLWETPVLRFNVRGPRWFQRSVERVLRWAFRWSRAEVEQRVTTRSFRVPDGNTLIERMRLSERDLRRIYQGQAAVAFVGPDVMRDLTREVSSMSFGSMDFWLGGPNGRRICGIEVVYVPWMEGALLVPEWRTPAGGPP